MNPLIHCVGFDASNLTSDQLTKIETFIQAHPEGDLQQVQLFPNFDATSDENIPTGMVVIHSPNAKVDPSSLGDALFQTLAVSKVVPQPGQTINDQYFEDKQAELMDAVEQFPAQPISGRVQNRLEHREIEAWSPELGGQDSFVGIYSKLRDDHRTKDYFVVGRGTAPLFVSDLKRAIGSAISKKQGPTYADLLEREEWSDLMGAAESAASRNICRSMLNAAEACGVEIMRADDLFNGAPVVDPNLASPELAVPEWIQPTHTVRKITFQGQPAVAVSYGVVPIENCYQLEDQHFFVVANPYDGISLFDMTRREDMQQMIGLPADTGRTTALENISTNTSDYTNRMHGIIWEKSDNPQFVGANYHVDLHPSAFRNVDKPFKRSLAKMGWNPEDHESRLICVLAKIYNPDKRRQ